MDTLQASVDHLIRRFVQRQQLPLEVIRQFRPHMVDSTKRRPSKEYASATGSGHWGDDNEWEYLLHGGGCRLIHTVTGEVIDWNAPNPYRFDSDSFVWWLTWFLAQNTEDESTSIILGQVNDQGDAFRNKIFAILEQLYQAGTLRRHSPDYPNNYELMG
ncbi:MAG: hypothetical protein ABI947_07645 [Chloroflexota bacterium]